MCLLAKKTVFCETAEGMSRADLTNPVRMYPRPAEGSFRLRFTSLAYIATKVEPAAGSPCERHDVLLDAECAVGGASAVKMGLLWRSAAWLDSGVRVGCVGVRCVYVYT